MAGRIYRLRKKSRNQYFYPKAYNDAASNITQAKTINGAMNILVPGIGGPKIIDIYFKKGTTSSSAIVEEVLAQQGITLKNVSSPGSKHVRYTFNSKEDRNAALSIINKMKNDKIIDANIDYSQDPPFVTTKNGLEIELEGWKKSNSGDPEYDSSSYGTPGDDVPTSEGSEEEKSSPNWLLIGGLSVVGLIAVLAIVKIIRK